jgi:hypothetical protein
MLLPMTKEELSGCYFKGTSRAALIMEELYEAIHDTKGSPIEDYDTVKQYVDEAIKKVRLELDIIKTAAQEKQGGDDHYIR